MRQAEDSRTGDLLEGFKRPIGRPPSGVGKTAAERKKLSRERRRASGVEEITVEVDREVADALRRFVQFKDMTLGAAATRILRDRLLRKR
jgi:hypothetical protein